MGNPINRLDEIPRVFDVAQLADLFFDLEGEWVVLIPLDQHVDIAIESG